MQITARDIKFPDYKAYRVYLATCRNIVNQFYKSMEEAEIYSKEIKDLSKAKVNDDGTVEGKVFFELHMSYEGYAGVTEVFVGVPTQGSDSFARVYLRCPNKYSRLPLKEVLRFVQAGKLSPQKLEELTYFYWNIVLQDNNAFSQVIGAKLSGKMVRFQPPQTQKRAPKGSSNRLPDDSIYFLECE